MLKFAAFCLLFNNCFEFKSEEKPQILKLRHKPLTYSQFLHRGEKSTKTQSNFQYEVPDDGLSITFGIGNPEQNIYFRVETGTQGAWVVYDGYSGKTPNTYDIQKSTTAVLTDEETIAYSGNLYMYGTTFSDQINNVFFVFNSSFNLLVYASAYIPYIKYEDNPALPFGGILGLAWNFDDNKKQPGPTSPFVVNLLAKYTNKVYSVIYKRHVSKNKHYTLPNGTIEANYGMSLGGTFSDLCDDDELVYFDLLPKEKSEQAMNFYIDKFQYKDYQKVFTQTTVRFDTGISFIYVPDAVLETLSRKIPFDLDLKTGLLMIDCAEQQKQEDLVFKLGGKEFRIPPSQYILNLGAPDGRCTFMVSYNVLDEPAANFTLGLTFLGQFCSVYNLGTNQVGLSSLFI